MFQQEIPSALAYAPSCNFCRAMAVNVGMMASYDQIKYVIVKARGQDDFMTRVVCAGIAGFACAWTSLPFDRIKTTMQDMTPDKNVGQLYLHYLFRLRLFHIFTGQIAIQEYCRLRSPAHRQGWASADVARLFHIRRPLRSSCHDLPLDHGHFCGHFQ